MYSSLSSCLQGLYFQILYFRTNEYFCRLEEAIPTFEVLHQEVDMLKNVFQSLKNQPNLVFCHNDLLIANFIYDEYEGLYAIFLKSIASLQSKGRGYVQYLSRFQH